MCARAHVCVCVIKTLSGLHHQNVVRYFQVVYSCICVRYFEVEELAATLTDDDMSDDESNLSSEESSGLIEDIYICIHTHTYIDTQKQYIKTHKNKYISTGMDRGRN